MGDVKPITEREFRAFIEKSSWTFAKSMPDIPHEYTLRRDAGNDGESAAAVQFIRDHGYTGQWFRRIGKYFDVDNRQYWTMGAPVNETILINRCLKGGQSSARRIDRVTN